jgi:quercetin dioxygenase-like cupin family protein
MKYWPWCRSFLNQLPDTIVTVNYTYYIMENEKQAPKTLGADQGDTVSMMGGNYRILVSGKETGGAFATIEMLVPPGGGPGPHAHAQFEESFYIVDGEVEVKSEAGTYTATKGAFISIPKGGIVHGFKNKSDKMAQLLCTVVPAGLEEMFLEMGTPVQAGQFLPPPAMDADTAKKMAAIAEKHGQKLYPPDYLG